MDCGRVARWLDDGLPAADPAAAEARAHAASCPRCAAALAAAEELDAALARAALAAPAGFSARVMERVARAGTARLAAASDLDEMSWWVRAAAEPAAALALALAALVLWQRAPLAHFAAAALQAMGDPAVAAAARRLLEPRLLLDLGAFSDPLVLGGVALALLPLAWWAGLALYHWSGDLPLPAPRRG
jgi:hypothetical protein